MAAELLSDVEIRNTKPTDKPRKLSDGNGLILLVHPNGSKYFQLRFTLHGKEKMLQLGSYPNMGLADAREAAKAARQLVASGMDPVQNKRIENAKKAASAATTFQSVAEQWLAIKQPDLAPTSHRKIIQTFNVNVYPRFGNLPISDIRALTVRDAMQAMEQRGALQLMEKCRSWIRNVFAFALAEEMIKHNPIPEKDLLLKKHRGESHPRLKNRDDAGQFLRNLFEYSGRAETRLAIWLQLLVATRPSELRLAEWVEFDLDKGLWIIPLDRMKSRKHMTEPHVVTLSLQAIAALKELYSLTSYSKLLFPSLINSTKPISDMTLSKALRTIWPNYRIVPHGFRHFFSTMANEHGQFRNDVIEAALAHKDANAIRSVYNRATYIDERRKLAQWWGDELEAMRAGGKVLTFKKGKV
ncbi:MAG: integrase arm-type DNA-binding domain-containing protein [Nitrosomonadaceae bacterium]|nr:integrase arm-type DNA-binding domain-containing protein [Nitrosomonadaceae bacterium]